MRYLLDTNVVSDLVRNPQGSAGAAIGAGGRRYVCTSIVVAAELRYGAIKKASPRLTDQLEALLGVMDVLALAPPVDREYGRLRARLEKGATNRHQRPPHRCAERRSGPYPRYRQSARVFANRGIVM